MSRRNNAFLSFVVLGWLAAAQTASIPKRPNIRPGVERWPIKTSIAGSLTGNPAPVEFSEFASFQNVPGVAKNDKRYQGQRIPELVDGKYKEGDMVALTGFLHLVASENDGDYHIQISGSPTDGNNCVVVEAPMPGPAYVQDPTLRSAVLIPRQLIKTKVLAGKEPSSVGNVIAHAPYVRVVGQLFYDDSHVGDPPRGKRGMKAATLWEIHPVVSISFPAPPQ